MESSGSGTIYTQLVLHYYVDENEIEPFEVEFEYSNDVIKRRSAEDTEQSKDICIKITAKSSDGETGSGMTLLMVEHASGYTYKSHEEIGVRFKIKKYEVDADKTTFYYDDLLEERELKFCMQYVEAVANPRPVFVSVQDYYNPSAKADTKVELTSRQVIHRCDAPRYSRPGFLFKLGQNLKKYFRVKMHVMSVAVHARNVSIVFHLVLQSMMIPTMAKPVSYPVQ